MEGAGDGTWKESIKWKKKEKERKKKVDFHVAFFEKENHLV